MRPLSPRVRKVLEDEIRMLYCAIRHYPRAGTCEGRVQWHHVWIYGGRQIDEPWAIVGSCERHHKLVDSDEYVRGMFQFESLKLTKPGELEKYPRKPWYQIEKQLRKML